MTDRIFARTLMLAGELDAGTQERLRLLCGSCGASLAARLKDGITPEDCPEEFMTAAGLLALAALACFTEPVQEFKAGDLTVKTGTAGDRGLERQAELLMAPYLKDRFLFTGV